jgi:hypothetical protein
LASAVPGSFVLIAHGGVPVELWIDYEAMSGMIFEPIPTVDGALAWISELEQHLNVRD